MESPSQCAAASIYLASAPGLENVAGQFFANSTPRKSSRRSYDLEAAARLWQVSEDLVRKPMSG
jgi:hypothetical protein